MAEAPEGYELRNGDWWPIEPSPATKPRYMEEWTLPRDYEPPRPLKAAEIARLGDALDEVEGLPNWRNDLHDALLDYFLAVQDKVWHEIAKCRRSKSMPSYGDGVRLNKERRKVREAFEAISALGSGATMREIIDARAAVALTEARYRIASRKYHDAQRFAVRAHREVRSIIDRRRRDK